jgi:FMN phosphatase YigB (HAD superfamily)
MRKINNIDGILFDLGSTLLEYENIPWDTLNLRCLHSGFSYLQNKNYLLPEFDFVRNEYIRIRQKYRDFAAETLNEWIITDALRELMLSIGLDGGQELADRFFEAYYRPVANQLTIFADTVTVLSELKNSGYKIGLVSNTIFPENYHNRELDRFGINQFLDFKIFSSSFGFRKPHPSIYKKAIELSGLSSDRLIFVGDRYIEDYTGPRQSGILSILKYRPGREYPSPFPENINMIKSLSELIPAVVNQIDEKM